MALLTLDERKAIFKELGLGEYNKTSIKAFQKKYLLRKSDYDGIYGTNTDNLLRTVYYTKKYTKNFKPTEFRCECGGRYCSGFPTYMKPAELIHIQKIRDHYGKPITITCGMRCKKYNASLGGSVQNSLHLKGQALDFYQSGVTDTLAHRKSAIKWIKKQSNHHYTYGNGINSSGYSVSAPYMGNALHTDTYDNVKPTHPTLKGTNTQETVKTPSTTQAVAKKAYSGEFPSGKITLNGSAEVAKKANEYCYKTNDSKAKYPSGKPTVAYKSALASLPYSKHKWCKAAQLGANCDVAVWVFVRMAGIANGFPSGLWKQLNYMEKHWKKVKASEAKAGDIGFYKKDVSGDHGHIFVCYSDGKVKEASHEQYYPKTIKALATRLSTKGKKYVYVFRPPDVTRNYLKSGDSGNEIKKLQAYLNWYDPKNKLAVDGIFGSATEKAVEAMQKALGLTADGLVGAKTIAEMKKVKK